MEVSEIKKLIEKYGNSPVYRRFLQEAAIGDKYYENSNDIKRVPIKIPEGNPLKTADNRLSHSWHGLLVDQKTGYLFGKDPTIDVGNQEQNKKLRKVLGDEWHKTLRELTIKASNKGISWLHFWIDNSGSFQYGLVPSEEIIPIYSNDLKRRLIAVIRRYRTEDSAGNVYTQYEYWDDTACYNFKCHGAYMYLPDNKVEDSQGNKSNSFKHKFGRVPFIYFNNNEKMRYDLLMYKDLVDAFDRTESGFANDIDDVQEIVFVLEGYGGEDLEEFMGDLKAYKAVKTDDKGDVRTIKAEIPVEARKTFLDNLKQSIFLFGMGVNPDRDSLGDSSGVALKFLYSLLELKASATRIEFECSIKVLVRCILKYLGIDEEQDINITFYKNMITNDKEVVEILSKSEGIISDETRTRNHPYTENLDEEIAQIKSENAETDDYATLTDNKTVTDDEEK